MRLRVRENVEAAIGLVSLGLLFVHGWQAIGVIGLIVFALVYSDDDVLTGELRVPRPVRRRPRKIKQPKPVFAEVSCPSLRDRRKESIKEAYLRLDPRWRAWLSSQEGTE